MTYDVFISYSRKDKKTVKEFCNTLSKSGITFWFDEEGIENGEDFKTIIVKAIEDSTIFLFFSSKDSNISIWTAKEIGIAVARNKHIIPIKLDNSNYNKAVEFDLVNLDFVDFTNKNSRNKSISKLIATIKNKISNDNSVINEADDSKDNRSKWYLWGGIIAIAIIGLCVYIALPDIHQQQQQDIGDTRIMELDSMLIAHENKLYETDGQVNYDSIDVQALIFTKEYFDKIDKQLISVSDSLELVNMQVRLTSLIDSVYMSYNYKYQEYKDIGAEIQASKYKQTMNILYNHTSFK